jgi:hypothetical protein
MPEFSPAEKIRSIIWACFMVLAFIFMVRTFQQNPLLFPSVKKWWNLLAGLFFIGFGGHAGLYPDKQIAGWIRTYKKWNEILHLPKNNPVFPTQRKLYSAPVTRTLGIALFVFGIVFLLQDFGDLGT